MKAKKSAAALTAVILLITLTSCQKSKTADFFAMDTVMSMTAYGKNAEAALGAAEDKIKELDRLFSVTKNDSDISKINVSNGFVSVNKDSESIIRRASEIAFATNGAFDITIRPITKLWGFTDKNPHVPSKEDIKNALSKTGADLLEISDGKIKCTGELDLGGIAKGYAGKCIREIFTENGIKHAAASLGGNVMLCGTRPDGKPWNVGITHPQKSNEIIGILKAFDTSVVTSGGYERSFTADGKTYHHIIDPKTGYPSDSGIISATVVTKDDTLADAVSTALYVVGTEKATEFWREHGGFDMILITETDILITDGIYNSFELSDDNFTVTKIDK